ncbi:HDOD domain-containing protein [Vibrio paucivorans]|uniref:Response regulator n=1 Tax=Vibrio paucivorans TaxID=2829489 RepID=A0A9X3HSA7_9VIBR|nr:HDOD domain-containing protein [Vibrio paucivorans]MCW8334840.1 response regulator [Vibrio paucivorans]
MRILLVDDERMILNGLKRALFGTRWKIHTAESGADALAFLEENDVDLIISDMLMPGMDGAELLEKVSKLYPGIIRASLSGYSDPQITIKGGFFAHQAFMKPCEPAVIKEEVNRIADILALFPDRVIQNAIGTITSLPITPKLFFQVKRLLEAPNSSMHDVAKLISQDPAMCAKIIHISNNAMFRGRKEIKSVTEAITRLGSQVVTNIIAMLEIYSLSLNEPSKPLEEIQEHSLSVALLASSMVEPEIRDTTFLVGILHRIGEYVRMKIAPDLMSAYLNPKTKGDDKTHLETYLFQTKSAQLGGYLLHFWGFPLPIIENVLLHDDPEKLKQHPFGPGGAVYIASCIVNDKPIDEGFLSHFGLEEKIKKWENSPHSKHC